tara:strand:- start:35 stop:247 length:213 start_codon:yes stop_codon:yes gene_type:complete
MNSEKITHEVRDLTTVGIPEISEIKFSGRVDINDLLARARKIKKKENKKNFIFFSLFSVLVLIVGINLSF